MNWIIGLIIGLVVGGLVVYLIMRSKKVVQKPDVDAPAIDQDLAKKRENLDKIKEYIQTRDKVTNDDIQSLLGVADATAERYLDDLEKEGLLKQVGTEGHEVYYIKV